jgi:hypothetical protein
MRNAYKILVRKSGEKRTLGRTRHRWGDNIKIDLKEIGCWLDLAGSGYAHLSTVLTFPVP